ncbi:MAG: GWxTD domain-containing protein [Bacteroidota bacterium]|nr:GWxTD domain-containing protein [Bacteroidota bacterium]
MYRIILCSVVLFCGLVFAQKEKTNGEISSIQRARYYQDFLNFASDQKGQTRLDVFVSVPYKEMQFVVSNEGLVSNYSISVSIFDENKDKLISEKTWNEKVNAPGFDNTLSRNNSNISLRSFYVAPGKYTVRTEVEDRETKNPISSESQFTVRDMNGEIICSDIMLISSMSNVGGTNRIVPNITRNVYSQKKGIPLFFEVYSKKDTTVSIVYKVADESNKIFYIENTTKKLDSGKTQIFYSIKDSSFSLGKYLIQVEVMDKDKKVLASTVKMFFSRWSGVPENIKDLDKAIAQLVYIATDKEMKAFKDAANKDEKLKLYLEFWKKKDPVPSTEENEVFDEYYRRINYANEHFTTYMEGWRSDRGMVSIIMGLPNNIDRHPFEYDSKPYEIWEYYNINRQFVFMDETGFGDYRLITPMTGDDFRYRK